MQFYEHERCQAQKPRAETGWQPTGDKYSHESLFTSRPQLSARMTVLVLKILHETKSALLLGAPPCPMVDCSCCIQLIHSWYHLYPFRDKIQSLAFVAGCSVAIWQTASNRAPLEVPLAPHMSEATTCLFNESGSYLFVAGTCIWLLLLSHEEQAEAKSARQVTELGHAWTQPSASGSGIFAARSGGKLRLPAGLIVQDLRAPHDKRHLVAITVCGELLIWKLDKAGLANHVIHHHPPLQV